MTSRSAAFLDNRRSQELEKDALNRDFNSLQENSVPAFQSELKKSYSRNRVLIPVTEDISARSVHVDRIVSIDILRALTMVLMIFVNDLGSLRNIPLWLDHVKPGVDGIGLADTIFPAFLFIVGMSLPYSLQNRRKKGDSQWQLVQHVLWRTIALLVMGVFLVNGETINKGACGIGFYVWDTLSCLSFILIWNVYPKKYSKILSNLCKGIGIVILVSLAYLYRGSEGGIINRFDPQWWGILGLIGWAYLVTGLFTIFSKGNLYILIAGWVLFSILSILYALKLVGDQEFLSSVPEPVMDGTLVAFALGGVIISSIFQYFRKRNENIKMTLTFLAISISLFGLAAYSHRFFILAKLGATPPWLFLCSAITILAFMLIYWLCDIKGKALWFSLIKPAGTDTLLCYLIPYLLMTFLYEVHLKLPHFLFSGGMGLLKSFVFAMLCVYITFGLNRAGLKLKL